MKDLEAYLGISRQALYQHQQRQAERHRQEQKVLAEVQTIRDRQPRLGTRKLWHLLQASGVSIGRDALFGLLRAQDLLLTPLRAGPRTTYPGWLRFPNLLADATVTAPNQAWVCDITYLATEQGFVYLSLVTDVFSRRIMGYDLSRSLAVEGALRALHMAIRTADQPLTGLIHHSDHGVQYTCYAYQACLTEQGIQPSMGAVGNCYENAIAERMNGILKQEYGLCFLFPNFRLADLAVHEAVWLYNCERPHLSLDYLFPMQVYQQPELLSVT